MKEERGLLGDLLWDISFVLFIILCVVLLIYNEKQIDIGLRKEATKCIALNYSVMTGANYIDTTNIENVEDFLANYKVVDIDDTNKVILLRKCK